MVSFRNNLNKILASPWSRNDWEIRVQRVSGTLFFDIVNDRNRNSLYSSPAAKPTSAATDPESEKFTYWGYKFEEICTRSSETSSENLDHTAEVDPNNQFCAVYKLKFNDFRCIVAAEIDCYDVERKAVASHPPAEQDDSAPPAKQRLVEKEFYVELKTSKLIQTDRDDFSFRRYKLLNFWIQSFVVGTPVVIVGFRDNNGIVQKTESFNVMRIPSMAADVWNPNDCLNCVTDLIAQAKKVCTESDRIYSIKFSHPFSAIEISETKLPLFLPADFVQWCTRSRHSTEPPTT